MVYIPTAYQNTDWWKIIQEHDGHWFDPETMDLWDSRIAWGSLTKVFDGLYAFVSSESDFRRTERLYSVRIAVNGKINTIDFQQYKTLDEAKRGLKKWVEESGFALLGN